MNKPMNYIIVTAITIFLIRALPLTLFKKPIKSPFIKSFLYYVPYVTLAVMTFPAILDTSSSIWPGLLALVLGTITAYKEKTMFVVTIVCCLTVYIVELFF